MVKYLAKFERWSFGVHYLHLKNVGSMLLIIQQEITPLFLLMCDIKHKKHLFWINTFQIAQKTCAAMQILHRCASPRVAAKSTTPNNFQKLAGLTMPTRKTNYVICPSLSPCAVINPIQCKSDISRSCISRNWIYHGRMLDPIFLPTDFSNFEDVAPKSAIFSAKSR